MPRRATAAYWAAQYARGRVARARVRALARAARAAARIEARAIAAREARAARAIAEAEARAEQAAAEAARIEAAATAADAGLDRLIGPLIDRDDARRAAPDWMALHRRGCLCRACVRRYPERLVPATWGDDWRTAAQGPP